MNDSKINWDHVNCTNFESTAFGDIHWIRKAKDLYESARRLEPEVVSVWESYRGRVQSNKTPLVADHYQGPYFMLLAYAAENLLKAAAVLLNGQRYKTEFRKKPKFPKELQEHDLVKLAQLVKLSFSTEEEDLLRRLTRGAVWAGRYPVPLKYAAMSGNQVYNDGKEYSITWFGGQDIERLNSFVRSLPKRLGLNEQQWDT